MIFLHANCLSRLGFIARDRARMAVAGKSKKQSLI